MPTPEQYHLHFIKSIKVLDSVIWNQLTGESYPFLRYEFLLALEETQCTTADSGWQPFHLIVESQQAGQDNKVIALMPLYLKTNSTGEYVFDWSWADAYQQHGIQYYPKLVSAIPFTPSAGPRICVDAQYDHAEITSLIANWIPQQARELNLSSWHMLFPDKALSDTLQEQNIQQRTACQYQWFNHNFNDFDAFLETFSSRKRKNIKKERVKIKDMGIEFKILEGHEITSEQWQHFYTFYQNTYFIRGRQPYLSKEFFVQLGQTMPDSLLLVMAIKDDKDIAAALSFKGADTFYGRYWGCSEEYQFLHFETCYYQGIEYCIKHDLKRFDSGAQGEHKIQRGFEPVLTYSNHWIAHPQFSQAIANFLDEEAGYIKNYIAQVRATLPFKKT